MMPSLWYLGEEAGQVAEAGEEAINQGGRQRKLTEEALRFSTPFHLSDIWKDPLLR